jgi:hypothetical protein
MRLLLTATQHALNIRKPFWLRFFEKIGAGMKGRPWAIHAAGALTAPSSGCTQDNGDADTTPPVTAREEGGQKLTQNLERDRLLKVMRGRR